MNAAHPFIASLIAGVLLLTACTEEEPSRPAAKPAANNARFRLLNPEQTGVHFQNTLEEGPNTNILMYEYFFNGGGVATGDFNGDGAPDLYFTSNMGENKLYLQVEGEGKIRFEDVSAESGGAGRPGPWKTGVSTVDINGDGRLDIYLCYSGALPDEKRKNQLFINTGNNDAGIPVFQEKAAAFGLDSDAFSTQAYFLDYDRDGDLDMLLLNHNPKNLPILNEVKTAELLRSDDPLRGLRLFQQDRGRFRDVTTRTGINGSPLSYGLGLGISDFNADGWPDFYVSNDYAVPDFLYINQKNGTFKNELSTSIGHTSQFSMGNDIADLNNDCRPDIITLDMLPEDNQRQKLLLAPDNYGKFELNVRSGFYYQYMRNMLQLNNGDGTFSEVGQYAGISNTDWSWSALAADFDNDGWRDIYITNGYFRDFTNLDFINYMDDYVRQKGRLMREDVLDIISKMPASDVVNYMFKGSETLQFENATKSWGLHQVSNSNGAVYVDLDRDGDLDLVTNNIQKPAFIFENLTNDSKDRKFLQIRLIGQGLNSQGIGTAIRAYAGGNSILVEQYPARGYQSSVSDILHLGLGNVVQVDSLLVNWPSGQQSMYEAIPVNQLITLQESEANGKGLKKARQESPVFRSIPSPVAFDHLSPGNRGDFDRQPLLINGQSFQGPCLVKGDIDGDGLEDLFIGGGAGQGAAVFIQKKNRKFVRTRQPAFDADKACEDSDAVIFDANGDGFADIYVASGGYHAFQPLDPLLQDRLYLNDGKGRFFRKNGALPALLSSKSCIAMADVNQDGHQDLFLGGRVTPGRHPETPASFLLINDGRGNFQDKTRDLAPALSRVGMVTDAAWTDVNRDQRPDLVVVGEWMPVKVFVNKDGKLNDQSREYLDKEYRGLWNKLEIADVNADDWPDLVIGNAGTNLQFKVAPRQPAELYFKDFDNNGSVDPVFCFHIQGTSYPYLTREELMRQLSYFRQRFDNYKSYAGVTLGNLFSGEELSGAGPLRIDHLKSSLFLGGEKGFRYQELPNQAQYAPVHAIQVFDFDRDGTEDILLCGNDSHFKIRLGKADANYGMLFRGNGQGAFDYAPAPECGLKLKGDVRSILRFEDLVIFGMNGQGLKAAQIGKKHKGNQQKHGD